LFFTVGKLTSCWLRRPLEDRTLAVKRIVPKTTLETTNNRCLVDKLVREVILLPSFKNKSAQTAGPAITAILLR